MTSIETKGTALVTGARIGARAPASFHRNGGKYPPAKPVALGLEPLKAAL